MRLLRGEDPETVSREPGVTVARVAQWRDQFLEFSQEVWLGSTRSIE